MKTRDFFIGIIAVVVIFAIVFLVGVYGFGFLKRTTADFRGETEAIEETQANGDYRIASYNHFYDLCASVKSLENKIDNMKSELEKTDKDQRELVLNASITASKNKRAELINTYNADARKDFTVGQFRASDLPYQLDVDEEETICTAR